MGIRGSFPNYVDNILAFFDHLSPYVDIFYGMNVDKKWSFSDHLPILSCKRSLWRTPNLNMWFCFDLKQTQKAIFSTYIGYFDKS